MRRLFLTTAILFMSAGCSVQAGTPDGGDPERGPLGKADRAGQCTPEDCGGPVGYGLCWCDDLCHEYGDCCDNKADVCGAPTCEPRECGAQPAIGKLCDDGSVLDMDVCTTQDDGTCGWEFPPCPEECTPLECGAMPAIGKLCDDGSVLEMDVCTTQDDGTCGWEFPPCPEACTPLECGAMPAIGKLCDDGSVLEMDVCTTQDDGTCGWEFPPCPEACTPLECGAKPEIGKLCDDGSVVGMDVCTTQDDGTCGWEFPPCPEPEPGEGPCTQSECGFAPLVAITCDGEQIITHADSCERNDDGLCEWTLPECE